MITDDEDESAIRHYDSDRNSIIDRPEALAAAFDYFEDLITNEEVLEVIQLLFHDRSLAADDETDPQ